MPWHTRGAVWAIAQYRWPAERKTSMIQASLASALYLLASPIALLIRLFGDSLALRRSHRGWRHWPQGQAGLRGAKKPYL